MRLGRCAREVEVARLMQLGAWPGAVEPELLAHAQGCRRCGDLVLVTTAFRHARAASISAARLPSAAALQWRAQLRRRAAAMERMNRPIVGAQVFALALMLLVGAGAAISQAGRGWSWLHGFAGWLVELPHSATFHLDALWPASAWKSGVSGMYLVPVLVLLGLVGGMMAFLAAEKQ